MAKGSDNLFPPQSQKELLRGWYLEGADRMRQILLHPPGRTANSQAWRQAWSAQRLAEIERALKKIDQEAAKLVGRGIADAVKAGIARADQQARDNGVRAERMLPGTFAMLNDEAVQLLAQDAMADLMKATQSMRNVAQSVLRQTSQLHLDEADIDRIVAGGLIEGKPRQAIRDLKRTLDRLIQHTDPKTGKKFDGLVAVVDRNGELRHFDSGFYAAMVYTAKTSEAQAKATCTRLGGYGIDLVEIDGNITENFCTAYVGKVFSISGAHPDYPPISRLKGPPFHPWCSKHPIAFIEELHTPEEIAAARMTPAEQVMIGKPAAQQQQTYRNIKSAAKPDVSRTTKPAEKTEAPEAQLQRMGVKSVSYAPADRQLWGSPLSMTERQEKLGRIESHLGELYRRFPKMQRPSIDTLHITSHDRGRATLGSYSPRELAVANPLAASSQQAFRDMEQLRGYRATAQRPEHWEKDNLYHEIGHNLTNGAVLVDWSAATAGRGKAWFKTNVSQYATTNVYEEIAEAFCMMTRPDYVRGTLPREMESVILKILGEK